MKSWIYKKSLIDPGEAHVRKLAEDMSPASRMGQLSEGCFHREVL